jgi:hypothetical protein
MDTERPARLAALNDRLRQTRAGGMVMVTRGVKARGEHFVGAALAAIAQQSIFDPADDPYGEHDFGAVEVEGVRLFWKIDYFDPSLRFAASDPADPSACRRVLTVMLAEEY